MLYENTREFALKSDREDKLRQYRRQFLFPKHEGKDVIYFCGNSLGLQPVTAKQLAEEVFTNWEKYGVEGHFKGENPWSAYGDLTLPMLPVTLNFRCTSGMWILPAGAPINI